MNYQGAILRLTFLLLFMCSIFASGQNNNSKQSILLQSELSGDVFIKDLTKRFIDDANYSPLEKTYLHLDKDLVSPGEDLWYSIYAVIRQKQEYSISSTLVYIELMGADGGVLLSQKQKLENGKGEGSMRIPKDLPSGYYTVRSYTNWMRNFDSDFFFTKRIYITGNQRIDEHLLTKSGEKIDLQFFPEGGYAIAGLYNKIAFKAIGVDGRGVNVSGQIVNSKGETLAPINSIYEGAGFFYLKPETHEEESYSVILDNNNTYELPRVQNEGFILNTNNSSPENLEVTISASDNLRDEPFYIVGHLRNQKYFQGKFNLEGKKALIFDIPNKIFPSGVMTLTLFNEAGKPMAERAIFINNQDELVINTRVSTDKLEARDKVVVEIDVTNTNGTPVSTDLSIAVTDLERVKKEDYGSNILSQLLLESEVKGHIENPMFYFKDKKRSTRLKLDLVMLINGWRRFNWKEEAISSTDKLAFDPKLSVTGVARHRDNRLFSNRKLRVISKSEAEIVMYTIQTDKRGRFSLDNLNYSESLDLVFNAYSYRNAPIDVKISLDEQEEKRIRKSGLNIKKLKAVENLREIVKENEEIKEYVKGTNLRRESDSLYNLKFGKVTKLDEVLLKNKKTKKQDNTRPSVYNLRPDKVVYAKDYNGNQDVSVLLSSISGVFFTGDNIIIRGGGNTIDPLWILDGIQILDGPGFNINGQPTNIPDIIRNLTTFNIERIEVLKGARAAIHGTRAAGGVILVYTKKGGSSIYDGISAPDFTVKGYSNSKEFYSPKYDVKKPEHIKPDYRTTLYWNPLITTNEKGKASIVFYNTDTTKEIQIDVQGLSDNGIPGVDLKTYRENKNNNK